jgi:hypothetical protein
MQKKKKQVERQMLPPNITLSFVFFTNEAPSSRFARKLSSTLVTLTRTSKKIRIFKFYLLFILNLLFIRKHIHPGAKTVLPLDVYI